MPGEGRDALIYAVRWPVLGCHLGRLALVQAVLTLPPMGVSLWFGEYAAGLRHLTLASFLLGIGWASARRDAPERIRLNEAMVIVSLAFLLSPLLMSWPLAAYGLTPLDAVFEAVSGVTTTGLTILRDVQGQSPGLLFTRAWMQWYGGLGFAVLAVALLVQPALAMRKLVEPGSGGLLVTSVHMHARRILVIYSCLTSAGVLLIWASGLSPFDALAHAFAAVSTGGFSTFGFGLGASMPVLSPYAVGFVCLLGAISLPLYHTALQRGPATLLSDPEVHLLLTALALLSLALLIWFRQQGMEVGQAAHHGLLMALAAQTTSGFGSLDMSSLDAFPKGLLLLAMATGGSMGSTAGGVKLWRILVLLRLIEQLLRRTAAPEHAVVEPHLAGRRLEGEEMQRTLMVILLFVGLVLPSWLIFLVYGHPPLDALFEVVSAAGTVGLSMGITGPDLPAFLKLVLCLDMLAGRLEILALLVTLYPGTWFGRIRED